MGRQNVEQEGERYGKSEDISKDGFQKSSSEDCFEKDRGEKDCKDDNGYEGRKQIHLRRLRPHRHCRHRLRLR